MNPQSMVSPDDQKVTFVELFFDLVFVFCVTQIVGLLHDGLSWGAVGQAVLIFWLVWWAWTQFTWALNAADTTHHFVGLATLVATGVTFFMAIAIPDAFQGRAAWFAVPYVLVRVIGLWLYARVAREADASQHAAVRLFSTVSLGGLVAVVVGGFAGGSAQYWLWGLAILLDVIAAGVGGRQEGWNLHGEHFAERHGLFVIIALGESLIVAAGAVTGESWTGDRIPIALLAVAIACALWWTYFPRAKPRLDHALTANAGSVQTMMARDVFSLLHFPMLCGVIAFAVAIEETMAHPADPLGLELRYALAAGLALFVGGMAVATWRATRHVLGFRLGVTGVMVVALVLLDGVAPAVTLGIALVGVMAIAIREHGATTPSLPAN